MTGNKLLRGFVAAFFAGIMVLGLAACGGEKKDGDKNLDAQGSQNTGQSDAGSSQTAQNGNDLPIIIGGIDADGLYDISVAEQAIASPLKEGESFLGAQYYNGERIWFIGNEEGSVFCYHEDKDERELLLEDVSALYRTGYTWYRDADYFYAYSRNVLAVLRTDGEEAYTLRLDGRIIDVSMTREGGMAVAAEDSTGFGIVLQAFDRENGTLSNGYPLFDCGGLAEGAAKGVLIKTSEGLYDFDMDSGEKTWYVKWNGTSYNPYGSGRLFYAFRITQEGVVEQLEGQEGTFYAANLTKISPEEMGKIPLVFRVGFANTGLKMLVAKFNQENQEYHVFIQDGFTQDDFTERNDMEIATGKGPDLFSEDAVSDIYSLAAKGALENLEPYLTEAGIDRGDYVPEAFQSLGREEGIYYAGYEMEASTMYIREDLAGSSLEALLKSMEDYEGQAVFNSSYNYTPNKLLGYFFQMSDDFYGMVNWEEKNCDFSGELWERILQVVNRYGVTDSNWQWEEIAMRVSCGRLWMFAADDAAAMQEGMVMAGFPTEQGMKNPLYLYGISINAASAHKEGAWQFIQFVLEEENQRIVENDSRLPVHEKTLQEYVEREAAEPNGFMASASPAEEVCVSEDQLERFWECLDNGELVPRRTEEILAIIREEAALYFTGDKTIEEVSDVIENRVRLYLAEQD